VKSKVPPVTEEEIKGFYDTNKDRVRIELAKVQDQIRDYLRGRKVEARKNEFVAVLRSNAKVTTYLKPPPLYRAEVNFIGAPIRGAEKAPVMIGKFEDFRCQFCQSAADV
jgi:protein-disulfide isomerase